MEYEVTLDSFKKKLFYQLVGIANGYRKHAIIFTIGLILLWPAGIVASIIALIYFSFNRQIEEFYNSSSFVNAKQQLKTQIDDMNDFAKHVNELFTEEESVKGVQLSYRTDSSTCNFKQKAYYPVQQNKYVCNCSIQVLRNAENDPFKYVLKYFNIPVTDESLRYFEQLSEIFQLREEVSTCRNEMLQNYILEFREALVSQEDKDLMDMAIIKSMAEFFEKSGIDKLKGRVVEVQPLVFTFNYISPGGNKRQSVNVPLDEDRIDYFVKYLSDTLETRSKAKYQRSLMTKAFRESIKERDDYTCQSCRNSTYNEPNLLLEIDHIIPISKGGLSVEDNLQTLCWRCNRSKSNKIVQ